MNKRFFILLLSCTAVLFLSACGTLESFDQVPDVTQIQNDPFYAEMLVTVELVKIPLMVVAFLSLAVGWKIGRIGLAINGFVIAGVLIYTYLGRLDFIPDENWKLGITITGAILSGVLAYFLYNLMALIIGGIIGTMLMNGAWFQVAEQVPPVILVFITTFISALVMFLVFRLFLVAFSAIIGAVILMIAVPFGTFWVIPVAIFGIVCQMVIAVIIKDDIFENMKGDFGAALREAFGDVLGPFGVLFDRQKEERDSKVERKATKSSPEPRAEKPQPSPQPSYQAPRQTYQPQQPYQAPRQPSQTQQPGYQSQQQPYQPQRPANQGQQTYQRQQPSNPAPQQPYRPPQTPIQANIPSQGQPPIAPTEVNLQQVTAFRPENFYLQLSTGEAFSLPAIGSQMTVGRSPDATITVNDLQVSGTHIYINIQADGVLLWDNNSTNGSFYNGIALTGSVLLKPADVIQLGDVTLRLVHRMPQQ